MKNALKNFSIKKFASDFSFKNFLFGLYMLLIGGLALYALIGIFLFKNIYADIQNPRAAFQVKPPIEATTNPVTVIKFLDYTCPYCKEVHPTIEELLQIRKDVRYIAIPIALFGEASEPILKRVLAAGLQGKFWEMHRAVLEYPETNIPLSFFEETAELYGLNLNKFKEDIESKEVAKIMQDNLELMVNAGISSTPTFMINKTIYYPREALPTLVDLIQILENES
ncbi:MAG: thioredoxin domain-containing protein [Pseudomonadota bacterium]